MTTVSKWSDVTVQLQSALAAADTITAITKANPASVTATGHGLSTGDFVKLTVVGMYQLDARVFRITVVDANTFTLDSEDSSAYDDFTSGTAEKITFGTNMATATGLSASGGDFDFIDITTIHDNVRKQIPGLASPATYSFENLWDPADAALDAFKTAADNQTQLAVKFVFASGAIVTFLGYVGATLLPTGNAQDKVTTPVVVTMFGRPTLYAS